MDTDADIRFIRRLRRDVEERARTVDSVCNQYLETVRPMHEQFIEPSKKYAHIIIPEGGTNTVAIDLLITKITVQFAGWGGYSCVLLLSLPNVYPTQKQVIPKLTTAIKSKILIGLALLSSRFLIKVSM